MRFYEFAPQAKPVLKIIQPQANTPPTPLPGNAASTTTATEPTRVYPRAWQHAWVQRYLAAKMAKDAQTIQPTELDIVKAFVLHAQAQRQADKVYAEKQRAMQKQPSADE